MCVKINYASGLHVNNEWGEDQLYVRL